MGYGIIEMGISFAKTNIFLKLFVAFAIIKKHEFVSKD